MAIEFSSLIRIGTSVAMIIVFEDDQTVGVFPHIESVRTACEAVDVEDGVYGFFDEYGRRLVPIVIKPVSRTSLFFGAIQSVGGGHFKLELDAQDDGSTFDQAIATAVAIDRNRWFASVADLARHVSDNRRRRT
jgi:hypothetical protein